MPVSIYSKFIKGTSKNFNSKAFIVLIVESLYLPEKYLHLLDHHRSITNLVVKKQRNHGM